MKKNILIIGIIILVFILVIIAYDMFANKNLKKNNLISELEKDVVSAKSNERNTIYISSLSDIPTPDLIIFYYNGLKKTFYRDTYEFNKIIDLNNKRDDKNLSPLELVVDIKELLANTNILEYFYQSYDSVYFNLIKDSEIKIDNTATNWVLIGYDAKVFNQCIYGGVFPADELISYLLSLK